ncbi:MAG: Trk system potassium transporter TrkA [Chlamydiota bacterium]|jgi:trk system potassium uptake protein TrkA
MNIVILGAGTLGTYVSSVLSSEEHNVVLIDKDLKRLNDISREIDVATIHGLGSNWTLYDDLLENKPEIFIAMTGDDETNLVSCAIAKNLGYPTTICRIKDLGYLARSRLDFAKLFFVDHFIAPEILAAHDIFKILLSTGGEGIENFAHGAIQMRNIHISENWDKSEIPIHSLGLPEELIIGAIKRQTQEGTNIIFPHGEDTLLPNDEITIVGETNIMLELPNFFGLNPIHLNSIIIAGGSTVGLHLARILESQHVSVKVIEKDELRCKKLSDNLPDSTILNHDVKDYSFLQSENVQLSDAFITCTKKDELNMVLSSLAKQIGCKKVISLISDTHLSQTLRKLEITPSLSEKLNIANRILSLIHEEKVLSITSLYDNQARIIEMRVSAESKLIGIPLSQLKGKIPKDLIIAVIENKGRVMIGKGNRVLSPHDTVIIISSPKHIQELQELF